MKKSIVIPTLAFAFFLTNAFAATPDSSGLPGDHLDLRATLDLFKKSKTPEDFEKKLNSKEQHVNNLDLNADGEVDYLRVYDIMKGDAHAIVIQDPVSSKESQDVAVIEIEKRGEESAIVQIRGDEEVYGANYVVEPKEGKTDSANQDLKHFNNAQTYVFVNVWYWPCVQYVYYPGYVMWVSPWYWSYYPWWWDPWSPYPYYTYYGWTVVYYDYYYCCEPGYVLTEAHSVYQPRRVVSPSVQTRYASAQTAHREEMKRNPQKNSPRNTQAQPGEQKRKAEPNTNPRQKPTEAPKPEPQEPKRKPDVQPQPTPTPAPTPQPAPNPRPSRVEPRPRPAPAPAPPRPAPRAPRPR